MNRKGVIDMIMEERGWSRPFAMEYAMERIVNGLSHGDAFDASLKSVGVKDEDKPLSSH